MTAATFNELVETALKNDLKQLDPRRSASADKVRQETFVRATPKGAAAAMSMTLKPPNWLPPKVPLRIARFVNAKPPAYVIDELLVAGRAANLCGLGGTSKTTLLMTWAVMVVLGIDMLGWRVCKTGHAVLVLAEDTVEDSQRSFADLIDHLKLSEQQVEELFEKLHIFSAAGQSIRLIDKGNLDESSARQRSFIDYCQSLKSVALIGLDPAAGLHNSSELDVNDMRELAMVVEKIAMKTQAAVVLVTHAAKAIQGYGNEMPGSHITRGSAALTDALRLEMLVLGMNSRLAKRYKIPDSERGRYIRFCVTKANKLPEIAWLPKWFARGEGGMLKLAQFGPHAADSPLAGLQENVLSLFLEPDPDTGELRAVRQKFVSLKNLCIDRQLVTSTSSAAQDTAARRLLQELQKLKLVEPLGQGFWELSALGLDQLNNCGSDPLADEVDAED